MTFDEVLTRFQVSKRYGNKAQCICPAHDDREASLSITRDNGKILIHCHAGCSTDQVLEAVGLQLKDLYEDDQIRTGDRWRSYVEGREGRKIEDVYEYVGLDGKYSFSRIRLSGKKFIYGIMDGDRFLYGLNGKRRQNLPAAVFCKGLQGVRKAIQDGQRVFYCEGEKDVKTVESHGLTGITCGASGDWDNRCTTLFEGADVVILQDNDDPGRKSAKQIEKDLQSVAQSVRIVTPTPDLEHGDITDFFESGHTVEDLEELLKQAPEIQETEDPEPTEAPEADGLDLSRFHFINEEGRPTGVFDFEIFRYLKETENILIVGGIPYMYDQGVFRPDPSGAMLKTKIRDLIYPELIRSNVIKRIYELFLQDADLQVKAESLNRYPSEWINFRNGFYDPTTKQLAKHDPCFRATNQIPWDYDPEKPVFGTEISDWLMSICGSAEDVEMLTQFCGLCLNRDTRQQKFLILCGDGGTGKSTLIRMINMMVGSDNISNVSLAQLQQRFFAYGLLGKLLNSCADLEIDCLSDVSTIKKLLGEDAITAESKGKDAVSFRSFAKLIFSTNQLPIVKAEQTNGFYRRLLILTMDKRPEKPSPDFFERLALHLDDFIRISVHALERMYEQGTITESPGSVEAVKRLRNDSDTVEAFLTEKIVRSPDGRIKKLDLYRSYESFCQDMGRQSLTKQNFYRSMRTKGYGEVKSSAGIECFKGIEYGENLRKTSVGFSVGGFQVIQGEISPFETG